MRAARDRGRGLCTSCWPVHGGRIWSYLEAALRQDGLNHFAGILLLTVEREATESPGSTRAVPTTKASPLPADLIYHMQESTMTKTCTVGTWSQLLWLALTFLAASSPSYSQETSQQDGISDKVKVTNIFSGPQPGEKLPPLKVRIVIGDKAGENVDIVSAARGKPTFLVFMNEWNEQVAELMRVITLYAEQKGKPQLVTAVVWLTSDPIELGAKLERARPHMPRNTPVGISLDGPEGPGAYGLNRNVQMTILVCERNVVTSNFALVQPSVHGDAVAVLRALVKVIGGKPPTLAEILAPREQQIVTTRIELMVDKSASDERVQQLARDLESYVRSRPDAKRTLGQQASAIVKSGRFNDRTKAIGYLHKWAKEYENNR